jgi:transposase
LKPSVLRTWAPKGQTPVLRYRFNWKRLSAISGITPTGYLYILLRDGTISSTQVIEFLRYLLRARRGRILLVWDRSPTHRARVVQDFLFRHRRRLTTEYLPPYAPELNPDEHLWSYLKYVGLANFCPDLLGDLRDELRRHIRRIKKRPKLIRSFCKNAGLVF